ncbi:hypothetical protein [Pseudomonas sp.]|uniref:hypothetical protein n=1 Tax=Pseudomonas sp. TaxID=306 RepID=UPI00258A18A6|nr:hypothetical protein [Pseudomonas sp.]
MKRCPSCGEEKSLDQFGSNRAKKDGLSVYCRECTRSKLRARYHADPESSREQLRQRYRKNPRKYRAMKRLEYERKKVADVAGKMLPWQAAEKLGISEAAFYHLVQKHKLSAAFVKPRWKPEQDAELLRLRQQGMTQKAISERMGRSLQAVRAQLRKLRNQ